MKRSHEMIILGIALGIFFWFLETAIHTFIFKEEIFWKELFPVYDPNELWMRFAVCIILVIFGFYAHFEIKKRKKIENELRKSEEELRLLSSQLFSFQEEERARLAGLLHDKIGQSLLAIKYGLEGLLSIRADKHGKAQNEKIHSLILNIQNTTEDFREIFMNLRPSTLDELGILSAINWYTRELKKIYTEINIEKNFNVRENEVPVSLRINIFRVLQEALKNIVEHSSAKNVIISIYIKEKYLKLTIKDDGSGFDLEKTLAADKSQRGHGIGSMKERVKLSGGRFVINSLKDKGTLVKVSWPVE